MTGPSPLGGGGARPADQFSGRSRKLQQFPGRRARVLLCHPASCQSSSRAWPPVTEEPAAWNRLREHPQPACWECWRLHLTNVCSGDWRQRPGRALASGTAPLYCCHRIWHLGSQSQQQGEPLGTDPSAGRRSGSTRCLLLRHSPSAPSPTLSHAAGGLGSCGCTR